MSIYQQQPDTVLNCQYRPYCGCNAVDCDSYKLLQFHHRCGEPVAPKSISQNMLCDECRPFFNQQWTQEFTNKGNYLEVGRFHSEASESDQLVKVKQSSCELCIFIAACPTTTASTSPFLETRLPRGGPQYSVCLLFSMVEHSLSIFNSKDTGEETFVSFNLSRNSGTHAVFVQIYFHTRSLSIYRYIKS